METNREHLREEAAKAAMGITGLLMRARLPEKAARLVANIAVGAAVIGAITYGTLTLTGCTTTVTQSADGSWSYSGIIVLPVDPCK